MNGIVIYGFWRGSRYGVGATVFPYGRRALIRALILNDRYERANGIRHARKRC